MAAAMACMSHKRKFDWLEPEQENLMNKRCRLMTPPRAAEASPPFSFAHKPLQTRNNNPASLFQPPPLPALDHPEYYLPPSKRRRLLRRSDLDEDDGLAPPPAGAYPGMYGGYDAQAMDTEQPPAPHRPAVPSSELLFTMDQVFFFFFKNKKQEEEERQNL